MMVLSSKRGCINHPDNFCYVCGEYTPPAHRVKVNSRIRYAYKHYFACQVDDQDKKICSTYLYLLQSLQNKSSVLAGW